MNPFEELIKELGILTDQPLKPDSNQSCLLTFPQQEVSVQIDLNTYGDMVLIGTQLGRLTPGSYRERIFRQAMRVNGMSTTRRGTLAFSNKNDTLVLFQYLPLLEQNGNTLFNFLQLFVEHAKVWTEAIKHSDIPSLEEDTAAPPNEGGMFGLNR